jgi:folate-dependent phosphoribosylglycinamide formyltransferase PurN
VLEAGHDFSVQGVIASKLNCGGVEIARRYGIDVFCQDFPGKGDADSTALRQFLVARRIDWIVLAGFIRPFPLLPEFAGKVINIHPALLPRFGGKGMFGLRVHQAVKEAGHTTTGATVHFVNRNYDEGAIIAQIDVKIDPAWEAEQIAAEVFRAEKVLLPRCVRGLITGTLPLSSGNVERIAFEP